jgi:type IV secretion system protein TrbF
MKNPFKSIVKNYSSPPPQTPFQEAKQAWDDRIGNARVQAKNWRFIAITSLLIALMLLVITIILATKKDRVFIAEVTQTGRVVNVAPLTIKYEPTTAQVEYFLIRFIESIRSLPLDPVVAKQNWLNAYNFLSPRGAQLLNVFFKANNPVTLLGNKTVTIKANAVNPISNATYQVDWTENAVNSNGQLEGQKQFSGVFTITVKQPTTQKAILQNPLGIFITNFHISARE